MVIRVLVFSLWLGLGGIEAVLKDLIENCPNRLTEFCIYSGVINPDYKKVFEGTGARVENRFSTEKEKEAVLETCEQRPDYMSLFFNLKGIVEKEKPDIILAFNHFEFVPMIMVGAVTNIPVVPVHHYAPAYLCRDFKNFNLVDRPFLQQALNNVISSYYAVSHYAARYITEHLLALPVPVDIEGNNAPVRPLSNGVHLDQFKKSDEARLFIRAQYSIPDDALVIGSVGRISLWQKRQDWVVEAVAHLHKCGFKNVYGMIVGDGMRHEIEKITQCVRDLDIKDFIIFPGEQKDPSPFYSAFDIFVNPSRAESFGLVTVEALACGLPTIMATPYQPRGIAEDGYGIIKNYYNGLVFHSNSKKVFIKTVEKLVKDKKLRDKFSAVARKSVEKFDVKNMAQGYYDVFVAEMKKERKPLSKGELDNLLKLMVLGDTYKFKRIKKSIKTHH